MKNISHPRLVAVVLMSLLFSAPLARSGELQSNVEDQLVTGLWRISGERLESNVTCTFKRDGTFSLAGFIFPRTQQTKPGGSPQHGRWTLEGQILELKFADGHAGSLPLPLDMHGTTYTGSDGERKIFVRLNPDGSPPTPVEMSDGEKSAATALLTGSPWRVSGGGNEEYGADGSGAWASIRMFNKDGTFTTRDNDREKGKWRFAGHSVILDFGNYTDTISLPLIPRGTCGTDRYQGPTMAVQLGAEDVPPPTDPPVTNALPADLGDMERLVTLHLLTREMWQISGILPDGKSPWSKLYRFMPVGDFENVADKSDHGTWRLSGRVIVMDYPDGRKATLALPISSHHTYGTDTSGAPTVALLVLARSVGSVATAPAPVAADAPAVVSDEDKKAAADLVTGYGKSLLFVNGKDGTGSGFIATLDGADFLVTDTHVAASVNIATFKALDGSVMQQGDASSAVGSDFLRMAVPAGGKPLEIMQGVDSGAAIGDTVVVFGNADGVVSPIFGKILGVGADRVEVDAPFAAANTGSPIIHLKTGRVIAMAVLTPAGAQAVPQKDPAKPETRRFGWRLDTVKKWEPVNWRTFYAQAEEMRKVEALTADLAAFAADITEHRGAITPGKHTNPAIKRSIDQWIQDRARNLSAADAARVNSGFLLSLRTACQVDIAGASRDMSYDYFRRAMAEQVQERNEISKTFGALIGGPGN